MLHLSQLQHWPNPPLRRPPWISSSMPFHGFKRTLNYLTTNSPNTYRHFPARPLFLPCPNKETIEALTKECDSLRSTIDMLMTPPSREVELCSKSSPCASSRNGRRARPGQANSPNQTVSTTNRFAVLASHDWRWTEQHLRGSDALWSQWQTWVWYTPQSSDLLPNAN